MSMGTSINTSNERRMDRLEKDLRNALHRLTESKEDNNQLTHANVELQRENDNLVTEIQDVLDENDDCHKKCGMLEEGLVEMKRKNSRLLQERDAVLETLQVQHEEHFKNGLGQEEVEELVQQARIQERSRIALMFGEQHRMQSAMVQMQQQKDELEHEVDRLQGLLIKKIGIERQQQSSNQLQQNSSTAQSSQTQAYASTAVAAAAATNTWLLNAAKGFFAKEDEVAASNSGTAVEQAQANMSNAKRALRRSSFSSTNNKVYSLPDLKNKKSSDLIHSSTSFDDSDMPVSECSTAGDSLFPPRLARNISSMDDNGFESFSFNPATSSCRPTSKLDRNASMACDILPPTSLSRFESDMTNVAVSPSGPASFGGGVLIPKRGSNSDMDLSELLNSFTLANARIERRTGRRGSGHKSRGGSSCTTTSSKSGLCLSFGQSSESLHFDDSVLLCTKKSRAAEDHAEPAFKFQLHLAPVVESNDSSRSVLGSNRSMVGSNRSMVGSSRTNMAGSSRTNIAGLSHSTLVAQHDLQPAEPQSEQYSFGLRKTKSSKSGDKAAIGASPRDKEEPSSVLKHMRVVASEGSLATAGRGKTAKVPRTRRTNFVQATSATLDQFRAAKYAALEEDHMDASYADF